jgi:PIN domain nuclease of toxin-antitoxin system
VDLLLDTQAFVDAFQGSEMPRRVRSLLSDPDTGRLMSAASIIEIAIKSDRLNMPEKLVRQAVNDLRISILPFDARHAYRLFSLPLHHRDPFDRMIIATALVEGIAVVGADRVFRKYKGLKVIW